MASKSGTSGGNQVGVHPDAWMMAYNPDIVVGAWGGNTGPNGAGKPVRAFGTNVGSTILREFVNSLPGNFRSEHAFVNGVRLHYVTGGRGEPLFLLPGWPQTWWEYRYILPTLASHFRVFAKLDDNATNFSIRFLPRVSGQYVLTLEDDTGLRSAPR